MPKPQIFCISHSFMLGKFVEYAPATPGDQLAYMEPGGYDLKPDTFQAVTQNSTLPNWWDNENLPDVANGGAKGDCASLIADATAERFIICPILANDIVTIGIGSGKYASFDALVNFHVQFVQEILITGKGVLPKNIMWLTGLPIKAETYGEIDYSSLSYKAASEGNVIHNITVAQTAIIPTLREMGIFIADTWTDCVADFPSVLALTDWYVDIDNHMHTSTKRGSEWSDRYLKPYWRRWLV